MSLGCGVCAGGGGHDGVRGVALAEPCVLGITRMQRPPAEPKQPGGPSRGTSSSYAPSPGKRFALACVLRVVHGALCCSRLACGHVTHAPRRLAPSRLRFHGDWCVLCLS